MGASESSHHQGGASAGQQIAVPQDAVPYPGPQIQYCLVTVQATLSAQGIAQGFYNGRGAGRPWTKCGLPILHVWPMVSFKTNVQGNQCSFVPSFFVGGGGGMTEPPTLDCFLSRLN